MPKHLVKKGVLWYSGQAITKGFTHTTTTENFGLSTKSFGGAQL